MTDGPCSGVERPKRMLGDKAYDSNELREELDEHGTKPIIPNRSNRKQPQSPLASASAWIFVLRPPRERLALLQDRHGHLLSSAPIQTMPPARRGGASPWAQ